MRSLPCETVDAASGMAYNEPGSACGLVSVRDFKSCGSRLAGPVGSIPTHFRHLYPRVPGGTERTACQGRARKKLLHIRSAAGMWFAYEPQEAPSHQAV